MLKALLERWARLEPERCHATTAGMFDIRCRAQEVIAVVGNLTSARPLGGPWLLAAIVDAIEARQGSWELECHEVRYRKEPAPKYSAIAHWRVPRDRPVDFNQFANLWASRDGATPAEALLRAYLAVLEAEEDWRTRQHASREAYDRGYTDALAAAGVVADVMDGDPTGTRIEPGRELEYLRSLE